MDKKAIVAKTKLFVLDMDGTFYLGNKILDGSLQFLQKVERAKKEFLFFTNNSSKSASDYVEKLKQMNCLIEDDQILTSGDVTSLYLRETYPNASVYVVGTKALQHSFLKSNINVVDTNADIVVVGFDTTLTYEKLEKACQMIREGAIFLATHLDINCPTEDSFIPDCGAICAAITLSTGVKPKYLGKPFKETLDLILKVSGYEKDEIAMVGDRLYTDVATGVNHNTTGILVLSGETCMADVENSTIQPTAVFESLKEISLYL